MNYNDVTLPATGAELFEMADNLRQQDNENRQQDNENMLQRVCWWLQLKDKGGKYWESVGCKSDVELLARLDLVVGASLAYREIIIRRFDILTVRVVGFDLLRQMFQIVSKFQPNKDQIARDCQNILDNTLNTDTPFDRQRFRDEINRYALANYSPTVKPSTANKTATAKATASNGASVKKKGSTK